MEKERYAKLTEEEKNVIRAKNAEDARQRRARRTDDDKKRISEYNKAYQAKLREGRTEEQKKKRMIQNHKWYLKNKERIIKKMTARLKTDPTFKVISYARSAVRRVLKFIKKSSKTTELIGCSPSELKTHLEKQFDSKMTWENYGPYWHVDHIIPCAAFDLSKPEEQRKCFHYTNLRPLEAKENLRKGARF